MNLPGKVAIIGGGTWATAIAKLVLCNTDSINWYIRNENTIEEFIRSGRNPMYYLGHKRHRTRRKPDYYRLPEKEFQSSGR